MAGNWDDIHLEVELFRDVDTGEALCRYSRAGHAVVNPLGSEAFLSWAVCGFYEATGSTISSALAKEAFLLLQAQAAKGRKTHVRVGEHGGKVYIDLCNEAFETVEITSEGWRVVTGAPVYFRGGAMAKPLPHPQRGGSFDALRSIVNFASFDDYVLTVAWLVAALNPAGPFPILALSSEHGSGKSTLMTLLQRLIDPQATERLAPLKDVDALFSMAASRWVVPLDNCGRIHREMSDHFCRLATGGGLTKRRLYSDNDAYAVSVTRPLILNGIALSLGRLDLLDRTFCVELAPFGKGKRKTEEQVYQRFEEVHPQLLGALCTAVSASLREKEYAPASLPRMADGAAFILRAERGGGLPWVEGTFAPALARLEEVKVDNALAEDLVGSAVLALMEERSGFIGTAGELLMSVRRQTPCEESAFLPKVPKSLSERLDELAPLLKSKGITLSKERTRQGRLLILKRGE